MSNCQNLFYLSALACELAKCLPEAELSVLSADLVVLGDMLVNIIERDALCNKPDQT